MEHHYVIQNIIDQIDCEVYGDPSGKFLSHLCTDSRHIIHTEHCMFIALKGERFDGHHYINQCIDKGISLFLISEKKYLPEKTNGNLLFILVKNSLTALQHIASFHRRQFKYPVVGITGSNGKTIVKEWLYQVCHSSISVVKNPKSFNSQIGVPFSVWNMSAFYQLGIFEAGISLPGEMEKLEKIIQPTIGIFTNIGPAHDEGFESRKEKIKEKLKLFAHCQKTIFCKDHVELDPILSNIPNIVSWGVNRESDYIFNYKSSESSTAIEVQSKNIRRIFHVKFRDAIALENVSHVITAALELNIETNKIEESLLQLQNLAMRLELKHGENNCLIIDDSYSADMLSLEAGLNFLMDQKGNLKPSLVLSPFDQSGLSNDEQINLLKQIIKPRNLHKLILVGNDFWVKKDLESYAHEVLIFQSTLDLLNEIGTISFDKEAILVKGSRKYHFEKIVSAIQAKSHRTILEINLNKLIDNLNFYRSKLKRGTKVIAMVKAHSYGSGSTEIAYTLQSNNVEYLAVAYADEGVWLRKNGVFIPIMVMNPSPEEIEILAMHNLEPAVYSLSFLKTLIDGIESKRFGRIKIHLKFETGMSRLGIKLDEIKEIISLIQSNNLIQIGSIFSHLAASEDHTEKDFSLQQIKKLNEIHDILMKQFGPIPKHILNSAGIISFPDQQDDFVRLGIGLYGIDTTNTCQDKLQFIGNLKTRIAQIKKIEAGDSVGYGRTDIVDSPRTIAILAIGYADGYDRRFSNGKGKVFINGKYAPTIGRVCMDMTMIDITDIDNVQTGQFVEVFGSNVSIIEAAESIGTIPYELLTNISERVKRIYTWE